MTNPRPPERFTFDLERIAPDWSDPPEREREWARVVAHYLPRLRDHFESVLGDFDLADDVVSHILRRAILKLHEIGSSHAAWEWFTRTGRNHLVDLSRRRHVEAARVAGYEREQAAQEGGVAPSDVFARVADSLDASGDGYLGGRIPINRTEWESRLAALSPEDRRLLELIEVDGKTHADAAAMLGLPSAAASRKRHSRARHLLRTGERAS